MLLYPECKLVFHLLYGSALIFVFRFSQLLLVSTCLDISGRESGSKSSLHGFFSRGWGIPSALAAVLRG